MEKIHREKFRIKFYDTDFESYAKLYSIINYMQETSEQHSTKIGIGYEALIKQGLFWVVSRIQVKINKYPKNMDNVIMETWPSGIDKLFFKRNFRLLDEEENVLVEILAYYLLIDSNAKFPQRPSRLQQEVEVIQERFGEDKKLDKIKMASNHIETQERKVTYSDIDLNLHVNNAKYIGWVEDLFDLAQYKERRISELQLNFVKEAKFQDIVMLNKYFNETEGNTYYIEGVNKEDNTQLFQCRVAFK
jgi:medium-chain acyl-[acyl-carrier-protein] hydrolase